MHSIAKIKSARAWSNRSVLRVTYMKHQRLVREILLKYHRGEPLTAEEQAILDAELAHFRTDRVWEKIRTRIGDKPTVLNFFVSQ